MTQGIIEVLGNFTGGGFSFRSVDAGSLADLRHNRGVIVEEDENGVHVHIGIANSENGQRLAETLADTAERAIAEAFPSYRVSGRRPLSPESPISGVTLTFTNSTEEGSDDAAIEA